MRLLPVTLVLVSLLASTAAFSSIYVWNPKKRVPISLRDALTKAEELLGEDAQNRYCIEVWLVGNEAFDGKGGAWNLWYAAEDGSKKIVSINMDGRSGVKLLNGPIDWTKHDGRRTGLGDVKIRLEQLFKNQGIDASVEVDDEKLICNYKTREFQTYEQMEDGSYGEELIEIVGPQSDGFTIVAYEQVADRGWRETNYFAPYWYHYRRMHLMTNSYLLVEVKWGRACHYIDELFAIFGETYDR